MFHRKLIRLTDVIFSAFGLIVLSPVLLLIALCIFFDTGLPVLYLQTRVGKDNRDFRLCKFRTMRKGADKNGLITIGANDSRITRSGSFLRRYKLDELPQLFNVIAGQMSLVGPRPEVRKYVDLYSPEQRVVLSVRPGITDLASIEFSNENEILQHAENPERCYIEELMPAKIRLNMYFINQPTFGNYMSVILKTILRITGRMNKR